MVARAVGERNKELRSNIMTLYEASKDSLGVRAAENAAHDALSDAYILGTFAAKWENHCRITGQHPYANTNDDGSIYPFIKVAS